MTRIDQKVRSADSDGTGRRGRFSTSIFTEPAVVRCHRSRRHDVKSNHTGTGTGGPIGKPVHHIEAFLGCLDEDDVTVANT